MKKKTIPMAVKNFVADAMQMTCDKLTAEGFNSQEVGAAIPPSLWVASVRSDRQDFTEALSDMLIVAMRQRATEHRAKAE